MGKLLVCLVLLGTMATVLQTTEAKPFLRLNFFTLTTRAPTAGSSSSSSSSLSSSSSFSSYKSSNNFQLPNIISSKLSLLTGLLSGGGGVSGGLGFGLKVGQQATTTTTTSKPTEVQTNYVPEATKSMTKTTKAATIATTVDKSDNSDTSAETADNVVSTSAISPAQPEPTVLPGSPATTTQKSSAANADNVELRAGFTTSASGNPQIQGAGYDYKTTSSNADSDKSEPKTGASDQVQTQGSRYDYQSASTNRGQAPAQGSFSSTGYRYRQPGSDKDNEISVEGTSNTYLPSLRVNING